MKRTHLLRQALDADFGTVYEVANRRVVDVTVARVPAARVAWVSEKVPHSASAR